MPLHTIPDVTADRFEGEGFASPLLLLGPAQADRVRREFDVFEAREGREKCQIGLLDRHFDQRFVWELATHPTVLDAVAAVIGPDVPGRGRLAFAR